MTKLYLVSFGAGRASLATVGYALYNADGTLNTARATAGVTERPAGSGTYGAEVTHDDDLHGEIRWDSGEGSPVYASETIVPTEAAIAAVLAAVNSLSQAGDGDTLRAYTVLVNGQAVAGVVVTGFRVDPLNSANLIRMGKQVTGADGRTWWMVTAGQTYHFYRADPSGRYVFRDPDVEVA